MSFKRMLSVCVAGLVCGFGGWASAHEFAVALNGNSEYLTAAADATFPPASNESATVEMWIKVDALPASGCTLAAWGREGWLGLHYLALSAAGHVEFNHWGAEHTYQASLTTGVWHHVCAVHDGPANMDYVYVDGSLLGSNAVPVLDVGRNPVRLGQHPSVPAYGFVGVMDEVRIWSVARTAAEIRASLFARLTAPAAGLEARWGLDEGTGTSAADSAGSGRTASFVGSPEWTAQVAPASALPAAPVSGALAFDGGGDYLHIGRAAAFPPAGNESVTVELWLSAAALPPPGQGVAVLAGWGNEGMGAMHFFALDSAGRLVFNHYGYDFTYPAVLSTGVWYHACAVHDGASNRDIVYLNGQPLGTNTMPALVVGRTKVRVGEHPNVLGYPFFGRIDELRVWSAARTPEEILASMNRRVAASAAGLAGQWGMDEGAGNVAASSSYDYRPAVLMGSPSWVAPGVPLAEAPTQPRVLAFDAASGGLTFGGIEDAVRYRVEWSDSLAPAVWRRYAPGLPLVLPQAGAGSQTVTVGMSRASCFYRVVAVTNEPPATVVSSAFDASPEGWQTVDFPYYYHVESPETYQIFYDWFGNPDNSLRVGDVYWETGVAAPEPYLGDKLAYYDGTLAYDLYIRYSDSTNYPAVVLNAGSVSVYYELPSPPAYEWCRLSVPLTEGGWKYNGSKESVDQASFLEILSNVTGLYIATEWHSGDDDTNIDNVTLTPP